MSGSPIRRRNYSSRELHTTAACNTYVFFIRVFLATPLVSETLRYWTVVCPLTLNAMLACSISFFSLISLSLSASGSARPARVPSRTILSTSRRSSGSSATPEASMFRFASCLARNTSIRIVESTVKSRRRLSAASDASRTAWDGETSCRNVSGWTVAMRSASACASASYAACRLYAAL